MREALETVFDHLMGNPEVAHYYEIAENITYLRAGMLAHCDRLFAARYDHAYYAATDEMGERHSRLEYHSHVYTAAYTNMLRASSSWPCRTATASPLTTSRP